MSCSRAAQTAVLSFFLHSYLNVSRSQSRCSPTTSSRSANMAETQNLIFFIDDSKSLCYNQPVIVPQ